jgi:hypothetical protein
VIAIRNSNTSIHRKILNMLLLDSRVLDGLWPMGM